NSTLSYRQQVTLKCYLGQGEQQSIPGDYPYTITPLVYWDAGGALVLNYLVDIDKFEFWQNNYDGYDPAFLLLNPHKIEKGIESAQTYNRADRYRTRDIYFDRRPTPGESVAIFARVFNYGFQAIPPDTLDVAFYYLDPTAGDSLVLISTERIFFGFEGRDDGLGQNLVSTTWTVPSSLGPDTKVVAIIDPDDQLKEEIHDYPVGNGISNNVGWTCAFVPNCQVPSGPQVLFPAGAATSAMGPTPSGVRAYPNPFSDQLTLDLDLSQASSVRWRVLTPQGQVIHEEAAQLAAGLHSLAVSSSTWPAGMYLYQFIGEGVQTTGKILLRR
ncbi:MAG: T9SS type A sorting domain-containing protein, partial [Bacteroidota bacterium]